MKIKPSFWLNNMENIAVFGGTFNPIHIGHIEMLEAINSQDFIDKVIIMPSKIPPHKEVDFLAEDKHRKAMCEIMASGYDKALVSDLELTREGKSFTIDTLSSLKGIYPDAKIYLTIGADMLLSFHTWKDYEKILDKASLICFNRGKSDETTILNAISNLESKGAEIISLPNEITDISSTIIRENIDKRDLLERYVPKAILDYIFKNSVFGG